MAVLDCALLSAVSAELVEAGAFSPPFGLSLSKSGGRLGTVRAEPVEAWAHTSTVRAELVEALACWLEKHARVQGGSRVVAPAGDLLSFASPKESKQRKGDPQSATPALRYGATCVVAAAGCAVELALRCARRSDNHGESVHEAWALRRPCSPRNRPAAGAASRGWTAEHPTAEQPHGPLLRSAPPAQRVALSPARGGRAQRWPVWMSDSRVPFTMRRGAQRPADQGSRLFERSEFERDPAGREHRRLPAAKRRDAACRVALSLVTFFRRDERKLLRRRAHTPAPAPCTSMLNASKNIAAKAIPTRANTPKSLKEEAHP